MHQTDATWEGNCASWVGYQCVPMESEDGTSWNFSPTDAAALVAACPNACDMCDVVEMMCTDGRIDDDQFKGPCLHPPPLRHPPPAHSHDLTFCLIKQIPFTEPVALDGLDTIATTH